MTYILNRRAAIVAGASAVLAPLPSFGAVTGSRNFRISRAGSDIGTHTLSVTREGDTVRAETVIDIAVKFLGVTAYRYEMAYTEVYQGGALQSLNGTSNDDGERGYVKAVRNGDSLEIDGSGYSGPAAGISVPTSYWRMPGLQATPWISTQSGKLFPVNVSQTPALPHSPAGARVFRATDFDEYTVDIWYDSIGDWTGCSFDAGGELGIYTLEPGSSSLISFAA